MKTLSTCWMRDGGAFGIATLLKAFLVETLLDQAVEGLSPAWRGGSVQVASSKELPSSCGGDQIRGGDRRLPHVCRVGCLQRTAAAGTALQLSVQRGTTSEGGAYGNDKVGRLDLQWFVAGGPATLWLLRCGPSSEDGASNNMACWHGDEGCSREWGNEMMSLDGCVSVV